MKNSIKPFEFKLKHEHYINRRISNMNSNDILEYLVKHYQSKKSTFQLIFNRDLLMEMAFRYKVSGGPLALAIMNCAVQYKLGLPLVLDFKLNPANFEDAVKKSYNTAYNSNMF